jgi:uncharacterized protein YecT (DUF1311 family)
MLVSHRLATLAIAVSILAPASAYAVDEYMRALSSGPTELALCGAGGMLAASVVCKKTDYDALTSKIEKALQAAVAKAPANIRPLLKRDQAWFNEIILNAAESMPQSDDEATRETFAETLRRRVPTLEAIATGFGRGGFAGKWANTFGSVTVTPADGGAYRLAFDASAVYGTGDDRRRTCKVSALVKPASGAWLTGAMTPDENRPAKAAADDKTTAAEDESSKPTSVKMRRQGETLRIVLGAQDWRDEEHPDCEYMWQLTASYFASGKDVSADKADTAFVTPTFDCTRPDTASDEEICADPDMAANDQKLNRAWKALLPRLDETTRRALIDDQHKWVKAQTNQYRNTCIRHGTRRRRKCISPPMRATSSNGCNASGSR